MIRIAGGGGCAATAQTNSLRYHFPACRNGPGLVAQTVSLRILPKRVGDTKSNSG